MDRPRSTLVGPPHTLGFDHFLVWIGEQLTCAAVGPDDSLVELTGGDHLALHLLLREADALCGRPHRPIGDLFEVTTVRHLYFLYLYTDSAPPEER